MIIISLSTKFLKKMLKCHLIMHKYQYNLLSYEFKYAYYDLLNTVLMSITYKVSYYLRLMVICLQSHLKWTKIFFSKTFSFAKLFA